MLLYKSNKKIRREFDCMLKNQLRLTLTNTDKSFFKVYPCCKYEWTYVDKPLGKIYFKDLKNIDLYETLVNIRKNNNLYNNVMLNCVGYHDTPENLKNYYCNWVNYPLENICVSTLESCNLKCKMCGYDHSPNKFLMDNYFYILETLKGHNLEGLGLTQLGEPFFYKKKTMDYLKSLTYNDFKHIDIITNASLLDDEDIELLSEINKTVQIVIIVSFDGITKKTYEFIRQNSNFEKVMHNALLMKEKNLLYSVNFVVTRETKGELLEAYEYWTNVVGTRFTAEPQGQIYNEIYNSSEFQTYLRILRG